MHFEVENQTFHIKRSDIIQKKIIDEHMVIDTKNDTFFMLEMKNRCFVYNPKAGTLLLGKQQPRGIVGSHKDILYQSRVKEPIENFVCGWVGTNKKQYKQGVIHFAENIPIDNINLFNAGCDTLEMFRKNGANDQTIVRGFGDVGERPLASILMPSVINTMDEIAKEQNPLKAAEMSSEQNYNMIDGQINNEATPKADLTDGQTYDELKELAPETLHGDKASLLGKLNTGKETVAEQPVLESSGKEKGERTL